MDGARIDLTPREFDLLYFFARHPGKVFSRMDLLNAVWGYQHEGYEHTVNTHINRLRAKIEADPAEPVRILTVWGRGYKLAAPGQGTHDEAHPYPAAVARVLGAAACVLGRVRVAADRANDMREQSRAGLSRDLAANIVNSVTHSAPLMDANGLRPDAVRTLFGQLMGVNPSVEVYLLDNAGRIKGDDAPPGHVKRDRVDLAPVQRFIAGEPLPILGDDPRSPDARKVFSAAPLQLAGQPPSGYIYVVLLGEAHDRLAARVDAGNVLRTTLWSMALVALLGLLAGLTAFSFITRPLRRLTDAMRRFDANGTPDTQPPVPRSRPGRRGDDIVVLESAFAQMADRIGDQWRALTPGPAAARTDHEHLARPAHAAHVAARLPGDTVAEVGHARRERAAALPGDRARAEREGRPARAGAVRLARLESGGVQAEREPFSLVDLVQDVFQKFELTAQARGVALHARIPPRVPVVSADLGMIERVLTNLLDNALRRPRTARSRSRSSRAATACS